MQQFSIKIIILFLVLCLNSFGIWGTGSAVAYFFDEESSFDNRMGATSLDFEVDYEINVPYRTQTPGGWGAPAHGNNPGVYRDANFGSAFSDGLKVGNDGGFTALFTSASAVEQFLPAGGSAESFTQNYVDPLTTEAGVLAGHITALSLSIGFDYWDENFGLNPEDLADFIMDGSSLCNGMTAGNVLNEANNILAGFPSVFSPAEMTVCLTEINEKFVDGVGGYVYEATVFNRGVLDFQYVVTAENFSSAICTQLTMEAKLDGITRYVGLLGDFTLTPSAFYSPPEDNWEFIIGGQEMFQVAGGFVCGFDLAFRGWQDNLPGFSGFRDTEVIHAEIILTPFSVPTPTLTLAPVVNNVVLNEFLPNPEGKDHLDEPLGEWVELYNNGDIQVDLNDWYIWDDSGAKGNKIFITGAINPNSWFVVYMNKAVLNNDGDTVNLYDNNDILIDSYRYDGSALENKSYARIPDGTGDWVDPIPTPGGPNILEMPLMTLFVAPLEEESEKTVTEVTVSPMSVLSEVAEVIEEVVEEEQVVAEETVEIIIEENNDPMEEIEVVAEEQEVVVEEPVEKPVEEEADIAIFEEAKDLNILVIPDEVEVLVAEEVVDTDESDNN